MCVYKFVHVTCCAYKVDKRFPKQKVSESACVVQDKRKGKGRYSLATESLQKVPEWD